MSRGTQLPVQILADAALQRAPPLSAFRLVRGVTLASFSYGFSIAVLNSAFDVMASELWACRPAELAIPSECADMSSRRVWLSHCEDCPSVCTELSPIDCTRLHWVKATIYASLYAGGVVGAGSTPLLLNQGRAHALRICALLFLIAAVSSAVSTSLAGVLWARVLTGIAVGIASVTTPLYISEVSPRERRGMFSTSHQVMVTVSAFIAMCLGLLFSDPAIDSMTIDESTGQITEYEVDLSSFQRAWWRVLLAMPALPASMLFYIFKEAYPFDTPTWYLEQQRHSDCYLCLQKLEHVVDVDTELQCLVQLHGPLQARLPLRKVYQNLQYRYALLVGLTLSIFQQFIGINLFLSSSNGMFQRAGLTFTEASLASAIMSGGNLIAGLPALCLVDRIGRRQLLLIGISLQCISLVPAIVFLWIDSDSDAAIVAQIIGIMCFVMSFALAYGPVLWVYLFEMFPMPMRNAATSLCTSANWAAALIMVFVGNLVLDNRILYTVMCGINLGALLWVFCFVRETKTRTLGDSPYCEVPSTQPKPPQTQSSASASISD